MVLQVLFVIKKSVLKKREACAGYDAFPCLLDRGHIRPHGISSFLLNGKAREIFIAIRDLLWYNTCSKILAVLKIQGGLLPVMTIDGYEGH